MEAVRSDDRRPAWRGRFTFAQKPIAAAGFIAVADILFYREQIGSTIGLFCLSLLAFLLVMRADILRHAHARIAAAAAALSALVLLYAPSLLGFALYWPMLTLAVVLPRTARFDDGWQWAMRLARHQLGALLGPLADRRRAAAARRRRYGRVGWNLQLVALPVVGSLVFLSLFASANPLIGDAFARIDLGGFFLGLHFTRPLFWLGVLVLVWSVLRPRHLRLTSETGGANADLVLPGVSVASIRLSLIAFNIVFALQNGLDLAFLWSGAPLPEGMTLAEYAHRGAYPLIVTALLAALFVLVTLRPGTGMAADPMIRRMVYAWIGQNLLLVASTLFRTIDYIEVYSLTRLRIAALIWMGLVAIGLVLICYRIWRSKSGPWLINANLLAALAALSFCSVVDLSRMAAAWNVRHAQEAGGRGARLDICYLGQLGSAALLPLVELEGRTRNPILRQRVGSARIRTMAELAEKQGRWRGWTGLGARRLRAAEAAVERRRLPSRYDGWTACDGPVPLQTLTVRNGR
jgi:hypothetical protein